MVPTATTAPAPANARGAEVFTIDQMQAMRLAVDCFRLDYAFAIRAVETRFSILRDEFLLMHDYNPIEHLTSRLKSDASLMEKIERRGMARDLDEIRRTITDIAGVRVTCSFPSDTYRLFEMFARQDDIVVRQVKDYIATPKPNGYRSLHAIVDVPIYLSTGRAEVPVEIQFRTIAMDFWASLEHKIHYKYDGRVPAELVAELEDAASTAYALDLRMERLHRQLHGDPAELPAVHADPVRRAHPV